MSKNADGNEENENNTDGDEKKFSYDLGGT